MTSNSRILGRESDVNTVSLDARRDETPHLRAVMSLDTGFVAVFAAYRVVNRKSEIGSRFPLYVPDSTDYNQRVPSGVQQCSDPECGRGR